MTFTLTFTYTETGTIDMNAESLNEAEQKLHDYLQDHGLEGLKHDIVDREWLIRE